MRSRKRVLVTGFGVFLIGVLAFSVFFWAQFQTIEVKGDSMVPTFNSGQRLLVSRAYWLVGRIRMDDFVVLRNPQTDEVIIKRVKGLPGDIMDFWLAPRSWRLAMGEYRVPPDSVYVLGDNRAVSQDSREFGAFEESAVMGKVVVFGTEQWLGALLALGAVSIVASLAAGAMGRRSRGTA